MTAPAPRIQLNDGHFIPQLGLGTSPLDDAQVEPAVLAALASGYRHIDTAVKYANERGVGAALAATDVPREEIFVTTKLDGEFQGDDRAVAGLDASLERLGLDHVDLLLIHWPLPQRDEFVSTWRTFIRLQEEGKARSIGVSNFKQAHLDRLIAETGVAPAVNQLQINPYIPRLSQRSHNADLGIVSESYSPLGSGAVLVSEPALAAIALEHGKTPGQIVLRWHTQHGLVAIPRSSSPERIAQNLAVFDFDLTTENLATLAGLAKGPDAGVDSDTGGH